MSGFVFVLFFCRYILPCILKAALEKLHFPSQPPKILFPLCASLFQWHTRDLLILYLFPNTREAGEIKPFSELYVSESTTYCTFRQQLSAGRGNPFVKLQRQFATLPTRSCSPILIFLEPFFFLSCCTLNITPRYIASSDVLPCCSIHFNDETLTHRHTSSLRKL